VGYEGSRCESDVDECASIPCKNGGTCNDALDEFSCSCTSGFNGERCETPVPCFLECPDQCNMNGQCEYDVKLGQCMCACSTGFYGLACADSTPVVPTVTSKTSSDTQVPNPIAVFTGHSFVPGLFGAFSCRITHLASSTVIVVPATVITEFNAVCVLPTTSAFPFGASEAVLTAAVSGDAIDGVLPFTHVGCGDGTVQVWEDCDSSQFCQSTCQCTAGYAGVNCETDVVDECASNPCQNGATCSSAGVVYTCECASNYAGDSCEMCASGHFGPTCTYDPEECDSSPCANGGTCSSSGDVVTCVCAAGYSGVTCSEAPATSGTGTATSAGSLSAIVLVGVALLLALAVVYAVKRRARDKAVAAQVEELLQRAMDESSESPMATPSSSTALTADDWDQSAPRTYTTEFENPWNNSNL
jgi:hypothetical protein